MYNKISHFMKNFFNKSEEQSLCYWTMKLSEIHPQSISPSLIKDGEEAGNNKNYTKKCRVE